MELPQVIALHWNLNTLFLYITSIYKNEYKVYFLTNFFLAHMEPEKER